MPLAILALTAAGLALAGLGDGYTPFLVALMALGTIAGVGLNILVGLTGQISLGHVGFYAIGAYGVGILTLAGWSFWIALPLAAAIAALIGAGLALPAIRVSGPYLAMMTIAFAFIVEHGAIEWEAVTGGQNGLMNIAQPSLGPLTGEPGVAALAVLLAGLSLLLFHRIAASGFGKAMIAVRDSETAARAIGLNPVVLKTAAFALSAALAGLAGGVFASLMAFIAPSSFPFSQSILFLLAVIVGGAGWTFGPMVGALVTVLLPEMIAGLAEYRLLAFGLLLMGVLWLAPEGIIGGLARLFPRASDRRAPGGDGFDIKKFFGERGSPEPLEVRGLTIAFGGIRAATEVAFTAEPGRITALIGPNGAGKTTVLNGVSGFYAPDAGAVLLGGDNLAGKPAWRVARAGIARTYQTTQLFGSLSVLDNVLLGLQRGALGNPLAETATSEEMAEAEGLLAFVGYSGPLDAPAASLAHVDRRLVEIARALAVRPKVMLLDEPAAGLSRADKAHLGRTLRRIAGAGVAVILVEHDMTLVMDISDRVVVLDAGRVIAAGAPDEVRHDNQVKVAYLGSGMAPVRRRRKPLGPAPQPELAVADLRAGYGPLPVLHGVALEVRPGELVALLGANGAGKSTLMRALSGLHRPVAGRIALGGDHIQALSAEKIARLGLALVPEGRQVFPELSVRDNLLLGAYGRKEIDADQALAAQLALFPRLKDRLHSRAGLLSGGEQQMLAIARGLMSKPRIVLLDEPSLGLAPALVDQLFTIIAELRDGGVTTLLVDQMATQALAAADRGYLLEAGRVVHSGGAEDLLSNSALESAYLGELKAGSGRERAPAAVQGQPCPVSRDRRG
jgi:ABC-type branched-subunit amino acid transport system ATPase component/ABC-type branched-subunit amino acid transport system permease subunit